MGVEEYIKESFIKKNLIFSNIFLTSKSINPPASPFFENVMNFYLKIIDFKEKFVKTVFLICFKKYCTKPHQVTASGIFNKIAQKN